MKSKPPYEYWLNWSINYKCNLNCGYCLPNQVFVNRLFNRIRQVNRIDVARLKHTLSQSKKILKIGITGGEPFLSPNIIDAIKVLTDKHYVYINTNLLPSKTRTFADYINPNMVLAITASLHLKELRKHGLFDRFFYNYYYCKRKGFNINIKIVAHPELISELGYYLKILNKWGVKYRFSFYRGRYKNKIYPKSYSEKALKIFGFKDVIGDDKRYLQFNCTKGNYCNAGFNVAYVDPKGDVYVCAQIKKKIGSIYSKIQFRDKITVCPKKICNCPFPIFDPYLFNCSINKNDIIIPKAQRYSKKFLDFMSFNTYY